MTITEIKKARSPFQPTGCWIRREKRLAIYLRDGFRCLVCNRNLAKADARDLTLDHVKCVSKGGTNEPENLYLCCRSCNSSRSNKPFAKFAGKAAQVIRRHLARKINVKLAKAILNGEIDRTDAIFAAR